MQRVPQAMYDRAHKARKQHFDNIDPHQLSGGAIRAGQRDQEGCDCPDCNPVLYGEHAAELQLALSGTAFCSHKPGFLTVLN